jgi:hypothetical protein
VANAQPHERNFNESFLLKEKFTREKVWDVQRSPAYPLKGMDWKLSGFKKAYDVSNNNIIDWGRFNDRYLMFIVEEDHSLRQGTFQNDVSRTKGKYNIALSLFERDGRFLKVISKWGNLIGFGSTGFMYVQQGVYGTFFSYEMMREGGAITYRPDVADVRNLSEIMDDRRERPHDNFDHNQDKRESGYGNHQRFDDKRATFLYRKYRQRHVWDAQRSPAYPMNGMSWKLSGFKMAMDVSNYRSFIDWGRDRNRYLMFELTDEYGNNPSALADDVNRTHTRYNVSLKLYEQDGRLVKIISRWGKLIGFGSGGFMYEQEGQLGTYFAAEGIDVFGVVNYRTDVAEIRVLSEVLR